MVFRPSDGECFILEINVIEIRKTNEAELLGLTIDHKLKSDAHVDKLCKTAKFKVQFKLPALRRIRKFLTPQPAKLSANSLYSQFGYAPPIWMFTIKSSINVGNK